MATEKAPSRYDQLRMMREAQATAFSRRPSKIRLDAAVDEVRAKMQRLEAENEQLKRQLAERNVTCPECEARRNATAARVRKHRAKGKKNARHDGVDN